MLSYFAAMSVAYILALWTRALMALRMTPRLRFGLYCPACRRYAFAWGDKPLRVVHTRRCDWLDVRRRAESKGGG